LRVAIDATPLFGARTGVGVFAAELLDRLRNRPDLDVVAYALTFRGRGQLDGLVPPGTRTASTTVPARVLHVVWRHASWPVIESFTGSVDVVHGVNYVVPAARRARALVSVHDLTPVHFPEMCTRSVRRFPALVRRAFGRGAHIHTGSRFVADEIAEWLGEGSDRIHPVPYGIDQRAMNIGDPDRGRRLAGSDRYILALGTVEPRKGLPVLVQAFDALATADADLRLVVAGPDGWGVADYDAAVARAHHRRRVTRLGWVDDRTRSDLLLGASVFAYPSRYEGFGLPPLEAMAAAVPVVTTRVGAIQEAVGDAAELVEPGDADALAAGLERVLDDEDRRAELTALGRSRVARFTWDRTADRMVDLYRDLAQAR
jgi:glycosyltransferase involved in cell wall biosynthesis